ncbi:hypothetical protein [Antrihabitans spumae]|uniref:Uncharacterized protein n=1 Tax=Antrihabitans spumae TaxID=3373370 RepID=A0ABW7K7J5_9NOCA
MESASDVDLRGLLGLRGRPAWLMLGLLLLTVVMVMLQNLDTTNNASLVVVCYAAIGVSATIVVLSRRDPIPLPYTFLIMIIGPVATYATLSNTRAPGQDSHILWTAFAYSLVLCLLIIRGRTAYAWIGVAATGVVVAQVDRGTDLGLSGIVGATAPVGTVAAVTVFMVIMRPAIQSLSDLRADATRRAAAEATMAAQNEERDRQLDRLDELARPVLERIARGEALDLAEREECRLLEAELRDGLRAPQLSSAEVVAATRGARSRGVEVVLLDDGGFADVGSGVRKTVLRIAAQELDGANEGSVTVRVLPRGKRFLATVLVSGPAVDRRTEFDRDGRISTTVEQADPA